MLSGQLSGVALRDLCGVNNRQQEVPAPDFCAVFSVVGDECVVTFHPHTSKWPDDGRGAAEFSQLTQITLISTGKQNTAELTSCFLLQESGESHLGWFPAAHLVSLESLSVTQKSITAPEDIPTFSRN